MPNLYIHFSHTDSYFFSVGTVSIYINLSLSITSQSYLFSISQFPLSTWIFTIYLPFASTSTSFVPFHYFTSTYPHLELSENLKPMSSVPFNCSHWIIIAKKPFSSRHDTVPDLYLHLEFSENVKPTSSVPFSCSHGIIIAKKPFSSRHDTVPDLYLHLEFSENVKPTSSVPFSCSHGIIIAKKPFSSRHDNVPDLYLHLEFSENVKPTSSVPFSCRHGIIITKKPLCWKAARGHNCNYLRNKHEKLAFTVCNGMAYIFFRLEKVSQFGHCSLSFWHFGDHKRIFA